MASNPYVNKVYKADGTKIIDISDSTINEESVLEGHVGYDASGRQFEGTAITGPAKSASDVTVNGASVTVPAGLYSAQVVKTIPSGSASTPATTKQQSKPSFTISGNVVTATVAATVFDVTPDVNAGYVSSGTSGRITMSANSNTYTLPTYDGSIS